MNKLKRVFKYLGFLILGLIIALLIAPFVFKDQILEEIKKFANESVNAEIDFKDVDVSFLRSFPEVSVEIQDLKVVGIDTFYGQNLVRAKSLALDFSLIPLFNKSAPKSIKYIGLTDADIDLLVLNDSLVNYLISKPSEDTTGVEFALEGYELNNCNLSYRDLTLPVEMHLRGVTHKGSGDIASAVYDLETSTQADSLSVVFDGFTYLKNVKAGLDADFHIDMDKLLFELKDNEIYINKLKARGNGSVQFVDDETMRINANLKTLGNNFGELISIFPYLSAYNTVNAKGSAAFSAVINGDYNGLKSIYPAFNLTLDIKNGSATYEGLDASISGVTALVNIKSTRQDMKDLEVTIDNAGLSVNQERITGNFKIRDGLTNARVTGNIKGGIKLENWKKALPLEGVEQLSGSISADLSFDARQSDIDKENYAAIGFNGTASANQLHYKSKDSPSVKVGSAMMTANPQKISLQTSAIQIGKSDLSLNGEVLHPMAYFSDNKNISGRVKVVSALMDMNEWNSTQSAAPSNDASSAFMPDLSAYSYSHIDADVDFKEILYGNHTVKNLKGIATLGIENVDVKSFSMNMDGSDVAFNGKLANVYSWMTGKGMLNGDLNVKAGKLDANAFMTKSSDIPVQEEEVLFKVPADVNLQLNADIEQLKYTNMTLDHFSGKVLVQNQVIYMTGLQAGTLGGKIGFDGLYDTSTESPAFNVKLNLDKMEFNKAFNQFITMKALAPVAQYINGVFNTTLVMEGKLGKGMLPDLSSLTVSGFIETINGLIKGFAPLAAAGDKLGLKEVSQMEIKDTRNWFEVKNGVVEIKEFTKNISGIDVKGLGNHKLSGDMDYQFDLRIPRKMLSKNVVTGTAMKGLGLLEKEASKVGLNLAQGEFIDVRLTLGGRIKDPKIGIKPLGTSGKSMEQELKDEVKLKAAQARDSITKVVQQKKEELKDTLRSRAEEEVDKVKQKAEEKANEVLNEAKDKVKKEVENKIDTLVGKTVSDTLKKKAEEVLKNKTGKDVEDLKNKVKDWNPFKKKKGGG